MQSPWGQAEERYATVLVVETQKRIGDIMPRLREEAISRRTHGGRRHEQGDEQDRDQERTAPG